MRVKEFSFREAYELHYHLPYLLLSEDFKEFTDSSLELESSNHQEFSRFCETLLLFFLKRLFWNELKEKVYIQKNVRCSYDEMDLLVKSEKLESLFFVELKSQRSLKEVKAWDRISFLKLKKMKRFVSRYLASRPEEEEYHHCLLCVSLNFLPSMKTPLKKGKKVFSACQLSFCELD